MQASFQDEFSAQAGDYARFRPAYPDALFALLAQLSPSTQMAWDCATGSGQAALALAAHFERIVATDASEEQIRHAEPHERVEYRVARAEESGLDASGVDLITVAQALHWFDLTALYRAVRTVLKPGGIIAVWSYNLFHCDPRIDPLINDFYHNTLGPYWPAARRHVENGYQDLDFPFEPVDAPEFEMTAQWDLEQLLGYLSTWSAVARYRKNTGMDPLMALRLQLAGLWGDPRQTRSVHWPLSLRIGRHKP